MGKQAGIKGGLIWSFGERITAQLVSTIVSIVLARFLEPDHYGIISIVTVFITLCDVFVTSGMGTALVQKKDITEDDYNTALSLNLLLGIVLYCVLFVSAPAIASFYEMNVLCDVIRIMGMRLPVAAINSIQQARIQRKMEFQRFFYATLLGTLSSAAVGITLACIGAGVWALVVQYLTNATINTVALFIIDRWIPRLKISIARAKEIFTFGSKVLASQMISTLTTDIRSLVIGKVFGSADLAFFDQGKRYPALVVNNVNAALNKVMLPAFSKCQDDLLKLKNMLRLSISVGIYVLAPVLIGFAAVSETFVSLILTDKWIPCIPYIQIFCLSYLTRPLESSCHQALLALGHAGVVLRILIVVDVANVLIIFVTVFLLEDILLTALGALLATLVSLLCFMVSARRIIDYLYIEQIYDIIPTLIVSCIMYAGVAWIGKYIDIEWLRFVIQIFIGIAIYLLGSHVLNLSGYQYMKQLIKGRKKV